MKQAVITGRIGKLVKEKDLLLSYEFNIEEKQAIIINIYCYNQKIKKRFIQIFENEPNIKLLIIGEIIVTEYNMVEILVEQFRFYNERSKDEEVIYVTDDNEFSCDFLDVNNNEEFEYYLNKAFEEFKKEIL